MCVLGLGGRKDAVEKKIGGGDVNGTSWFMVLSCHRQACIRSFPFFFLFFNYFIFFKGGSLMLLWLPHQPSPYKG